jgi:choline dehydrogenase
VDQFDYVIVGGGSAGSVLAYRLTMAGKTVCVLEAGPSDTNPWIRIPAGFIKTLSDLRVTWQFETQPCDGTAARTIRIPQGKVLGGSSAVNGAIYNRGQAADFDHWAQLGNSGWGYRDALPYFVRTERRIGEADERYRGRSGRLPIGTNRLRVPVSGAFVASAVAAGLPLNPDHNGAEQFGVGYTQSAIHHGIRVSAAHAFLHPARKASAEVRTHALVTGIILDDRRATGVAYRRPGDATRYRVTARECVILCAGAANTPKILQLSGIGPSELLRQHGIAVAAHRPGVGENLRDHYNARLVARGRPGMDGINSRVTGWRLGLEVLRWLAQRPSALGVSPALVHVFGKSDPALSDPDFFLVFSPGSYKAGHVGRLDDFPGLSCAGCPLRPDSTGTIRIASSDPEAAPQIQPNYLAVESDRRILLAALRMARRIISGPPLQAYVEAETMPGPAVQTDDEWLDFARRCGGTSFHLAGTCKMGPAGDAAAVVDDRLRVHGIDGLRIADASIMPTLVSANTYAATLMIAEKASDMILGRAPLPAADLS